MEWKEGVSAGTKSAGASRGSGSPGKRTEYVVDFESCIFRTLCEADGVCVRPEGRAVCDIGGKREGAISAKNESAAAKICNI